MIFLQLFACGERGVQQEPLPDPASNKMSVNNSWLHDAMPMIQEIDLGSYSGSDYQGDLIAHYQAAEGLTGATLGTEQIRNLADGSGQISFQEYIFTHSSTSPEPVYAISSGYLYYLDQGRSDEALLGGAETQPGEKILLLKPLPTHVDTWKKIHPGNQPLLEEWAYLNVEPVSDTDLKDLISKSNTEDYFQRVYKAIKGVDYAGSGDWPTEYLQLFKDYTDVPICVRGGAQIGTTKENSPSDQTQRLSMYFSTGGAWSGNSDAVITFFRYHQRSHAMGGHPLITQLIGHSVRSGTVDVIAPYTGAGSRTRDWLITEFSKLAASGNPDHHPLALDVDQHPHRLIVPIPPDQAILPISNLTLRPDHFLTRLKISNPLQEQINIGGFDPAQVNISPTAFSAPDQVVEISATPNSPGETTIEISTADGTVVHQLTLTFMAFHAVPVKFYKLIDSNPNHLTRMDEPTLRDVLAYANEILGRQTNVYLYPVEENGLILHDYHFGYDLGDPIVESWPGITGAEDLYDAFAPGRQSENLQVMFVWDIDFKGSVGITYRPGGLGHPDYALIMIDTHPSLGNNANVSDIAKTLVHETGHWISTVFVLWKAGMTECTGGHQHFSHGECEGGNWSYSGNLMAPKGTDNIFITFDQAVLYNDNADEIIP